MSKRKTKPVPAALVADPAALEDGSAPTPGACPVVGIGASAGGLEAFTQLLRALPADTGMAFVLVQHLAPSHTSALAEILSRVTSMPVEEVSAECVVAPDRVYVIPPGQNITIAGGKLSLIKREAQGQHHPVDLFFQSLAQDLGHRSIGVVLSGTATDGTLGLEEIKAAGGLTFAQDDTAQYQGMPRSAISSGCVDRVLAPADIAAEIARIARHPYVAVRVGPFVEDTESPAPSEAASKDKAKLAPILRLLGESMRVDFEQYKVTTLQRRITRRMVLLKLTEIDEYASYLGAHPAEAEQLFSDILINVTSFFRDPATFRALAVTITKLIEGRSRHEPLRIWVPGCSTGEEAYSLAMLVAEATESRGGHPPLQLFATDLNPACIQRARAGVFPKHALRSLSKERVQRFFVPADGDHRIIKSIRDACVFAVHNVLSDPPLSRMDLVSCRNLLIYLEPVAQKRVISLLHYALRPTGYLALGGSETVGVSDELFEAVDIRHKIYRRVPGLVRLLPSMLGSHDRIGGRETPGGKEAPRVAPRGGSLTQLADRMLLQRFVPPGVLVDAAFEILQFSGDTAPYLAPKSGKASLNLLNLAREGLAIPLRAAVQRAKKSRSAVREEGVRLDSGGQEIELDLEVIPIRGETKAAPPDGFQILFEERAPAAKPSGRARRGPAPRKPAGRGSPSKLERLEGELAAARDQLRVLLEREQAGNEELQSANEEAQSTNEELQSINEELQTSKEEIQSSNEELTTVNDELHTRSVEMENLNNDLTNLILSIDMPVLIVGRDLCIRRFSPAAGKLFSVISSDLGRPISDIRSKIDLPDLPVLLSEAIDTVSMREREVQDEAGTWYSLRIRPYVTLDNKIDGAVVLLVEVDRLKRAQEYSESLVATVRQPLLVLDEELRVQSANRAFYATFGVEPDETLGHRLYELGGGQWDIPALSKQLKEVLPKDNSFENFVVDHEFDNVGRRVMLLNARRLRWSGVRQQRILLAIQDITEQQRLERELRDRVEQLIAAESVENDFLAVLGHELGMPLSVSLMWVNLLQRPGTSMEEIHKGLEVIHANTKQQYALIGDLLDAHRVSTGKVSLDLQRVDLLAAVDAAIAAMQPIALEKEIRLERERDAQPTQVSGDPRRIQQVLSNLLANALKFTPRGGQIQVTLHAYQARVDVSVIDTGEGIAPEVLPRIFERFRQADPLTSRLHGGLGLGLAVAKQLVELHGGVISASSPGKGKGSTFTFSLPLRLASDEHNVVLEDASSAVRPVSLSGIKILVVDDDAGARESLRRVFEGVGAEVLTVASADEALHIVRTQAPDVLLSEIVLPVRSGYELMREIRALPAESGGRIPAIALTAYPSTSTQDWAVKAGFLASLDKPVKAHRLIAAVAAVALRARAGPA